MDCETTSSLLREQHARARHPPPPSPLSSWPPARPSSPRQPSFSCRLAFAAAFAAASSSFWCLHCAVAALLAVASALLASAWPPCAASTTSCCFRLGCLARPDYRAGGPTRP